MTTQLLGKTIGTRRVTHKKSGVGGGGITWTLACDVCGAIVEKKTRNISRAKRKLCPCIIPLYTVLQVLRTRSILFASVELMCSPDLVSYYIRKFRKIFRWKPFSRSRAWQKQESIESDKMKKFVGSLRRNGMFELVISEARKELYPFRNN